MKKVIATPSRTKEVLRDYNIRLNKKMGQNFLTDPNIMDRIIEAAEIQGDEVIFEIGPGIGSLTEFLLGALDEKGKLFAIEKDTRFKKILNDLFNTDKLKIISKDVMNIEWSSFIEKKGISNKKDIKVIANLPYYITTPIIMSLLESDFNFSNLVFMVQKEVAERMASEPGPKDYGALSIAVQFYTKTEIIHNVPPTAFLPQPKVDSSIIRLKPYKKTPYSVKNKEFFFEIVKAIFQQRRKNIKNGLSKAAEIHLEKDIVLEALENCGIDRRIRGEKLSIEKLAELSNVIWDIIKNK
jgi:16S rRNA (adenine1518-N6/adenine1519-N6)-dimethyltransferase